VTRRRPWDAPELPVACWCGHAMRPFTREQIRTGTAGWSCGRPDCTEDQP